MAAAGAVFLLVSAPVWLVFLDTLQASRTSYDAPGAMQLPWWQFLGFFEDLFYRQLRPGETHANPSANLVVFAAILALLVSGRALLRDRRTLAVAIACRELGAGNPALFRDALRALDRAIGLDPANMDARVALGELFLAKYNGSEAQQTFDEALRINASFPAALVGAAARLVFDGQPGADSLLAAALAVGMTILLSTRLRCLHPPSGALAILVVIDHAVRPGHTADLLALARDKGQFLASGDSMKQAAGKADQRAQPRQPARRDNIVSKD